MPDRLRRTPPVPLVASAQVMDRRTANDRILFEDESWQNEAWSFMDSLGEFNFGINWLSQALSRVRLTAAEQLPGGGEPVPLTEGPAADLMEQLGGGIGGRAVIMRSLGVQLGVPGEGWLVAQRPDISVPLALADWSVKSTEEIQPSRDKNSDFEIQVGERDWKPLPPESLVSRIWEPHKRWSWKADSSSRSAIPIMREIDLYNRRIIATMVSRLAMNGILLIPQEGTIAVPPQYADAVDPFVSMLIDIASNNIKNPGGASSSIPIPVRFPSELIEKWKHLAFGDGVDDPLLKARDSAIGRLATTLNMPAEVLKGMGDTSHWNAWQITEEGIKLHISPTAETIVGGITIGYLHPMLLADGQSLIGPRGGKIVCWYDPSELTSRPDKSGQALTLYDRGELSGTALRRESGFDEGDKPTVDELHDMVLKKQALATPALSEQALGELTGQPVTPQTPVAGVPHPSGPGGAGDKTSAPAPAAPPATGPPPTRDKPPPPPGPGPAGPGKPAAAPPPVAAVFPPGPRISRELVTATNGHHRDDG
jgi:hypothetical protein